MSRVCVQASSQYMEYSGAALAGNGPLTMDCQFFTADITTVQALVHEGVNSGSSSNQQRIQLLARGDVGGDPVTFACVSFDAGATGTASSTTSYQASTWQYAAGMLYSSGNRRVMLNGGGHASNTTSVTVTGLATTVIAARYAGTVGRSGAYLNGTICNVGIWNEGLSDVEVQLRWLGWPADRIRNWALKGWWKMERPQAPEPDATHENHPMVVTGATYGQNHPWQMKMKSLMSYFAPAAVAGAGATIPIFDHHYRMMRAG